jgi:hypothetical protein
MFLKLFQKIGKKEALLNSFYKVSITGYQNQIRTSLMNTDEIGLNVTFVN